MISMLHQHWYTQLIVSQDDHLHSVTSSLAIWTLPSCPLPVFSLSLLVLLFILHELC